MKTRSFTLLILLLSVLTVFTVPSPAHAAYSDCLTGQSCLWAVEDGSGTPVVMAFSTYHDGKCHNLSLAPLGGYHSAKGNYGYPYMFIVYLLTNCSGANYTLADGATKSFSLSSGFKFQSFRISP